MGIHRDPADFSLSSVLGEIACDDLHGRGLAGPIRSQESDDLAPGDAEGDLVEGLLFAIILYKFLYFDRHTAGLRYESMLICCICVFSLPRVIAKQHQSDGDGDEDQ